MTTFKHEIEKFSGEGNPHAWFREYEGLSRASGFNSDTGRFAQLQFWLEAASEAREFFLTNSGANGSCSDYKDAKDAICAEFWTTVKVRAVVNSFQRPSQSQREGEDVVSFHRRFLKSLAEHNEARGLLVPNSPH